MKFPQFKNKYVAKLIKIKEHFDLCNISRLKNSDMKKFTFRQKHAFDFIQRKLVYFVISNSLQKVADFFATLLTDRSAVTISISKSKNRIHGHDFWKFRSFQKNVRKTKNLIQTFHSNHNLIPNAQLRWELLRYKVRKSKFKSQRGLRHIYICCFFVLLRFQTKLRVVFQYTFIEILSLYLTKLFIVLGLLL